jgi:hypothetical protein
MLAGAPAAGPLVTLSIGVATQIPMDNMHSDLLVARADQGTLRGETFRKEFRPLGRGSAGRL